MADRSVKYTFKGDFSDLKAGLTTAGKNVKEFGTKLTALDRNGAQMRAGLTQLGNTAGRFSVAIAGGMAFAAKAAIDWETAWTGVLKTVDGSPAQLAKLETGLRDLAKETGFAHAEVAAVAEAAGQLGISTDGVAAFTRTMLDMGVSTNLSSEEAATGLARLRNIMGTTEGEIRNTGSAMVALGNNFATTEGEILAMSLRLAGAGRQAGLTTPDVLGLATAMSSVGIEAEAGGTAMSLTMKRIGKEVETGGEKLDLFASTAGMTVQDFTAAWERDAPAALAAFVAGLGDAEAKGMSTNAVLRELGITGIREADALLRLSANAEGLAAALDLSSEGFERNNALTQESGKFYGTTAQQAKRAWADIKDAAIDAGSVMLPIISRTAEAVGSLANGFQALPDPVKNVTVSLGALTAIFGGGLWFGSKVIQGIADTRQALASLGPSATSTATSLAKIGATAAGVLTTAAAVSALADSWGRIDPSKIDAALKALSRGEETDTITKVVDSLEQLDSTWNKIDLGEIVTLGGILGDSSLDKFAENIDQVDRQLASMVEGGNAEAAAELLAEIVAMAEARGVEGAADRFDDYALALRNTSGESGEAADATYDLSTAQGRAQKRVDDYAKSQEKSAEALKEAREAARDQASAWLTLGDSLDDAKASLSDWIKEMEQQAQALTEFADNAETAANRGLRQGLIDALAEMGPAGAMRMKQLANATDAEIKRANKSWRDGQQAINRYTDVLGGVPDSVATDLELRDDEAQRKIREIQRQLANIPREIRTSYYVTQMQRVVKPELMKPSADGGPVPKTGLGYQDRHPYLLADGEFVVSNRNGQVDRNLALLWAINAGRLADGGRPGRGGMAVGMPTSGTLGDRIAIIGLLQQIRDLRRDLGRDGKNRLTGLDREAARLDLRRAQIELRNAMNREQRERRQEQREKAREQRQDRRELRSGRGDLFASIFPQEEQSTVQQVSAAIKAYRAEWEAAGGTWTKAMREWAKGARANAREYDKLASNIETVTALYEDNAEALDAATSAAADLKASVAGIFDNNIFGSGLANAMLQLEADYNDTRERDALLQAIGASGGIDTTSEAFKALATSADMQTLRDLDTLAEIKAYQALYEDRFSAQQAAGQYAAEAAYATTISELKRAMAYQQAALDQWSTQMETIAGDMATNVQTATQTGASWGSYIGTYNGAKEAMASQQKKANLKAGTR